MLPLCLSLTLVVPAWACQSKPPASVVGFRGDAAHTGVYSAPTPEAYAGLAWRFQTGGTIVSSPAVTGLAVYVGSNDGHLYAIDRASGRVLWAFDAKSGVSSSPLVRGDLVAFTSADGHVFGLDAASGRLRWRLTTGPEIPFPWGHESGDMWTSSPAYADGLLLVGAGDGPVVRGGCPLRESSLATADRRAGSLVPRGRGAEWCTWEARTASSTRPISRAGGNAGGSIPKATRSIQASSASTGAPSNRPRRSPATWCSSARVTVFSTRWIETPAGNAGVTTTRSRG